MSGDFPEQDHRDRDRRDRDRDRSGLAEWLDGWTTPDRRDADVPDRSGGPAYVVSFGWLPSRLPPTSSASSVPLAPLASSVPVVPLPRRALDDLR
ncbi:MAG: hypothetical protein HOV94_19405 [Saccharothrix sp.]|nr:hypothetical protein [Saccharothrix sp.]